MPTNERSHTYTHARAHACKYNEARKLYCLFLLYIFIVYFYCNILFSNFLMNKFSNCIVEIKP